MYASQMLDHSYTQLAGWERTVRDLRLAREAKLSSSRDNNNKRNGAKAGVPCPQP